MESLESEQYYLLQRMDFYYKKKMYEMNTGMKMGCMVCNGILYPFNCDPKEIMATYKKNQLQYMFLDVLCRGKYPRSLGRYFEENHIQPFIYGR